MWGSHPFLERERSKWKKSTADEKAWDPHLRSTSAVSGYKMEALDGEIGHLDDFVIDDETWAIRYLVVSTRNWWPGGKVLISPQWIERVDWKEASISVNLSRDAIKRSPEYTEDALITRDYEAGLHGHYHRPGYWTGEPVAPERSHETKTPSKQNR